MTRKKTRKLSKASRDAAERLEKFEALVFRKLLAQPEFAEYLARTWGVRPIVDRDRRSIDVAIERLARSR
jgi:hypothetical protein